MNRVRVSNGAISSGLLALAVVIELSTCQHAVLRVGVYQNIQNSDFDTGPEGPELEG